MPTTVLKDFWFPFLLFLAGIPLVFVGLSMSGNGRRVCWTISALLVFLAVLSFIWGDPVRGPFAYLTNPKNPEEFAFQAGITCHFPVKRLKDGISFSNCMGLPGPPIQLWLKKTWWSGLDVRMTIMGPNENVVLQYADAKVKSLDSDFDLNHDDYAIEVVNERRAPLFQLLMDEDYAEVYVNAILYQENGMVFVLKDRSFQRMTVQEANKPENKLDRIFKYPSYAHHGER